MKPSKNTGTSGMKSTSSAPPAQRKYPTFFISGEGIDREVITTDICRYLGNDALVKPGVHTDPNTRISQNGFYITAYRAPTSEQLADLRASSAKWREEKQRGTARSQGGYGESDTQQEVRMRSNLDEPRVQPGGYPPTSYGSMPQPMNPTMGPRPTEYSARVAYENAGGGTAMPPPAVPPNRYAGYQPEHYTYSASQNQQPGYSVMDNNRNRMDMPQGQPWNMQQSSGYPSSGAPPPQPGYGGPGRGTYNYSPVAGNPSVPPGYGREAQDNYDPYPPRDSGVQQSEPQGYNYGPNEDDTMDDYEEPPQAQVPAQVQHRRERERDSRERHEEPTKKRHGHRS